MRGPSSTALLIAASLQLQRREGIAADLPDEILMLAAACLDEAGWVWRSLAYTLRWRLTRRVLNRIERALLPGIQRHYLLRKQTLWRWTELAYRDGFRQLLVLGAGCDGLGAAFSQFERTRVVELDHPATQALKRKALCRLPVPQNLQTLPIDFANENFVRVLHGTQLHADAPTLVIAEGLLMYLQPRRCAQLLHALRSWSRGPLRLAFSVMEPDARGRPAFAAAHPAITRWLAWRGEPFRWALRPDQLASVVARLGLHVIDLHDPAAPPQPPLPGWTPCPGERLILVENERAAFNSSVTGR